MTNLILVGNPNSGKTTFFNTLTKSNNHVGNWHGVTVEVAHKHFAHFGKKYTLYDLPGIYALQDFSKEEQIATTFLNQHSQDLVINICDAHNLKRSLLLTLQLIEQGYKVVVAVNMANEVKDINYRELEKQLGVLVVPIDARKRKNLHVFMQQIQNLKLQNPVSFSYYKHLCASSEVNNKIRYKFIDKIINVVDQQPDKIYGISKLDKILMNKYFALPIFLLVMLLVFVITFGAIGNNFSVIIGTIFDAFLDLINDLLCKLNLSAWAHSLIMQGVLGAAGVVVGFLPQVVLLFLCMNFLEDVGYLSRVAIMFDGALKKIGLSGKSLFSIILGFGCTTTAMLTTRALDNIKLRKRTALIVPFASCSAKLPIYALICSAFFAKHKALIVFLMYVLGILVGLLVAFIASKINKRPKENFVIELPPLRLPTIKKTFTNLLTNVLSFISRVGGTIVICSVGFWVLSNISFSLEYVSDVQNSIIYTIAKFIHPIFKPLGFDSPLIVVALIVGVLAKEMVVSCLAISNGIVGNMSALASSLALSTSIVHFTPASAMAFLVFVLLYSPCISALSVTAKEIGRRFAAFVFIFQFALAYAAALLTYTLTRLLGVGKIIECIIIIALLALTVFAVIKYVRKKRGCSGCKGTYCGKTCMQKNK